MAEALDIPASSIKSYDHCHNKEEIELEIYGEYLAAGLPETVASEMAQQIAADLWGAQS